MPKNAYTLHDTNTPNRYNLTDPTLPRYFQIKNRILIVSAEHDWAVAEQYRIQSERIYAEAVSLTKPKEIAEKRVLAALRIELDELKERHGGNPLLYEVGAAELKHGESQEEVVSSKEVKGELNENTSPRGEVEEELTDEAAAVQGLSLTKISE